MNRFAVLFWLLPGTSAWAHHTRDHMMLVEDAAQVVAATREGGNGNLAWLAWTGAIILLLLGFVRWWRNRK